MFSPATFALRAARFAIGGGKDIVWRLGESEQAPAGGLSSFPVTWPPSPDATALEPSRTAPGVGPRMRHCSTRCIPKPAPARRQCDRSAAARTFVVCSPAWRPSRSRSTAAVIRVPQAFARVRGVVHRRHESFPLQIGNPNGNRAGFQVTIPISIMLTVPSRMLWGRG